MNAIDARVEKIAARLRVLPGASERLAALVDRAKRLPEPRLDERVDANLVPGCVSRVWLAGDCPDGVMRFRADADSAVVKGLVTLLWEITNDQRASDFIDMADEPGVFAALGLQAHVSPTRLHGLGQVWRRMREMARSRASESPEREIENGMG